MNVKDDMSLEQQIEELIIPAIRNAPLGVDTGWPYSRIRSHWGLDMFPDKKEKLYAAYHKVIERYIEAGLIREEPLCVDASQYVWVKK